MGCSASHPTSTEGQCNTHPTSTEGQSNTHPTSTEGHCNTHPTSTEGQSNTHPTSTEGQSNTHPTSTEGQCNTHPTSTEVQCNTHPTSTEIQSNTHPTSTEIQSNTVNIMEKDMQKLILKSKTSSAPNGVSLSWMSADIDRLLNDEGYDEHRADEFRWWNVVDKLNSRTPMTVKPDTKRKTWKTIRLFVSSTFKDMNSEREHLVKQIFPQLRQWCEGRKLRLIECDLRWGIPKDSDTSQTFIGCLSQIDRCREENGCPYFLCMLSERYGWCPQPDQVPEHIKTRYKWMPGVSVTSLEIFTGAYWDQNPNALFMLRSPDYLNNVKNAACKGACTESKGTSAESLNALKGKLRERFPQQVREYRAQVTHPDAEDLHLTGLEDFGQTVLQNFKALIDRQYPSDSLGENLSLGEIQKLEHENFMIQRSQVLLGRDDILTEVRKYIEGGNSGPTPLVLVGSPGAGKSAVVAYCAKEFNSKTKYKTFYHFVGATPGSTDLYQILNRLWTDLTPTEDTPGDLDEMVRSMETMFVRATDLANKEGFEKLVIFIDALNQMDSEGDAQSLRWLPSCLPDNMRVVVSTLDGKCRDALRNKKSPARELMVEPLDVNIRKQIVTEILVEYSKTLDLEQLSKLVAKEDAGRPLWLSIACEELRVFGSFNQLTQKIVDLPGQLIGLLDTVLARIISSYGGDLVKATLCLIEASRFGLLETELVELLAVEPVIPSLTSSRDGRYRKTEDKIPMAKWAMIFLGLKQYLRPSGNSGEGRLDFYHRTISKVVRNVYMENEESAVIWHTRLADYFEHCSDAERKAEELPYHCHAIGDMDRLKACLLEQDVFEILYQESTKLQLMKYWQAIGGYDIAAEAYANALASYKQEKNLVEIEDIEPIQVKVGWFLLDIGQYDLAQTLLEEVLQMITNKHGEGAKLMSRCLVALVTLFYRHALTFVYGSNPNYGLCFQMGSKYGSACVQLYKRYWPENSLELGRTLGLCGYFCTDVLQEAMTILEKVGDKRALAHVLYIIGEKQQYNPDMNVPISLFKQSLDLCLSECGRYHLQTARCYQLYGQLFWNTYVTDGSRKLEWMEQCLPLYEHELEILEEVLGAFHPTTVRSREDVIIILQTLHRDGDANALAQKQPAEHDAV